MNQPTPQQTVARMHRGMRNYVAAQKPGDPICQLPDSHIRGLAGAAFGALPVPRDTEVTRRAPRRPTAETEAMQLPVLELLASERSVDEIGQVLGLSVGQVDHAMRWLYRRLGVSSRHGAVLAAVAAGWLRLDGGVWRAAEGAEIASGAGVSPD